MRGRQGGLHAVRRGDSDTGMYLMALAGHALQHGTRLLVILGFTQDQAVDADGGVGRQYRQHLGVVVAQCTQAGGRFFACQPDDIIRRQLTLDHGVIDIGRQDFEFDTDLLQ